MMDEEEQLLAIRQHHQAFGGHTGLSEHCRFMINQIKSNSNSVDRLMLNELIETGEFSDLAWKLLGRYIAKNTNLKILGLHSCGISNKKMALLCGELWRSELHTLDLKCNSFGIEGMRSMIPLIQGEFKELSFSRNNNFGTECFELLLQTLDGIFSTAENLHVVRCNITDISALETYPPSNLTVLNLSRNSIGRNGCRTLANILQESGSTLKHLYLLSTGIGDEETELLATSLKHNTSLESLYMTGNNITKRGKDAFLKLLVDVSSIKNTDNSNHTLTTLTIDDTLHSHLESALHLNKTSKNSEAAGRAKVIKYQLNSQRRRKLCFMQGVEYSSIANLFVDIDPLLLPRILSLIGRERGQSEFYTALIPMVPGLMSYIDRRALIDDAIAENSRYVATASLE